MLGFHWRETPIGGMILRRGVAVDVSSPWWVHRRARHIPGVDRDYWAYWLSQTTKVDIGKDWTKKVKICEKVIATERFDDYHNDLDD